MEFKQFDEYTKEEIKELLSHWFNYYGTKVYNLEEYGKFMQMVEKEPNNMFEVAAMLYYNGLGSTPLLDAIRGDKHNLESYITKYQTLENITKLYLKRDFIEEVVESYNNPEKSISIEDRQLRQQLKDLTGKDYRYFPRIDFNELNTHSKENIRKLITLIKKAKSEGEKEKFSNELFKLLQNLQTATIDPERVKEIFISCMFKESDIADEKPTKLCSIVDVLDKVYFLDTEKVNEYKFEIKDMIDLLPDLRKPTSFSNLCLDRANHVWTRNSQMMEILMVLGIAAERIEYSYPRSDWREKNNGIPMVVETGNNIYKRISGYRPNEIDEILEAIEEERQEDNTTVDITNTIELFKLQYPKIETIMKMSGYKIKFEDNSFYLCRLDDEKISKMHLETTMEGLSLVARDGDYSIKYSYNVDGFCAYGGKIDRNILSINGIKKLDDETFDGRQIIVEVGNGLINATNDPRLEITIFEPSSENVKTHFQVDDFGMIFSIENDEEINGKKLNGTKRVVGYTDVLKTPANKAVPLLILEKDISGDCYSVGIDGFVEGTFKHALSRVNADNSGNVVVLNNNLKPTSEVMPIVNEYLKTSRVKNLYRHISTHIESVLPGMKEFIKNNYPLASNIENIMSENVKKEFEDRLNSNAIKNADLPEDKVGIKKELKPEDK